jgi:hypothetical protein
MYPNPSEGTINFFNAEDFTSIIVTDLQGKKVFEDQVRPELNSIDLSGYPKGIYIVTLRSTTKNINNKVIIH